jgi:flagellar protein FliT
MIAENQREARIIACYEEMALISGQMLAAARNSEWDHVIDAEKRCAALVTELKTLGDLNPSDPKLRDQKRALIRTILVHDAGIRDLAEPRVRQLELKLNGSRNARKLALAYGASLRPY